MSTCEKGESKNGRGGRTAPWVHGTLSRSAVVVHQGEVGLEKGESCLATRAVSHRTSRPLAPQVHCVP